MIQIVPVVCGLLALLAGWFIYGMIHTVRGLPDAYAQWDTAEVIKDYLDHHDAAWPRNWADLRESYDRLAGASVLHGSQSFANLQTRIGVDWNADPIKIIADANAGKPAKVIWPLSGNQTVWNGADGNELVLGHLRSRAATQPISVGG